MTAPTGTAKHLGADRLRGFEGDDTDDHDMSALLPPRPTPTHRTAPRDTPSTNPTASPTPAAGSAETTTPAAAMNPARTPRPKRPPARQRSVMRASNAQIPAELIPRMKQARADTGRSNGDIIIDAIEYAHDRLDELCRGRAATTGSGGGLFTPRTSRGIRSLDGPLTPLNVRLRDEDWDVIDGLVDKFAAFSRGHLITVALLEYFTKN